MCGEMNEKIESEIKCPNCEDPVWIVGGRGGVCPSCDCPVEG
jgi:hypothetical protein